MIIENANWSTLALYGSFLYTSGAVYSHVPQVVRLTVCSSLMLERGPRSCIALLLSPKSVILTRCDASSSRFSGFRSRWMIMVGRRSWRYRIPLVVSSIQPSDLPMGKGRPSRLAKRSARLPPGMNSLTMHSGCATVIAPRNCTCNNGGPTCKRVRK